MFTMEIRTGNAAFCGPDGEEDAYYSSAEVVRLLRKVANTLEATEGAAWSGTLIDINGNNVGKWKLD